MTTFPTRYVYVVCINDIDEFMGYDIETYARRKDAEARAAAINASGRGPTAHVISKKLIRDDRDAPRSWV